MKTLEEVQQMLDESVNVLLGQHRGRAEITRLDRNANVAYVTMVGGCRGCAGAKYTLRMIITNHIVAFDPTIVDVVDITDHSDKTNAFFKE